MTTLILTSSTSTLLLGIVGSGVAALIVLFLFFILLRPRLAVMPCVAYNKKFDTKQKKEYLHCQIAIRNKSLFPCNDLRIKLNKVGRAKNGEESREEMIPPKTILTLNGRWRNENLSQVTIGFNLPDLGMPEEMCLTILSQHSVSGIVLGVEHRFSVTDFKEGNYERGVFVPAGQTYKQSLMQSNMHNLKVALAILAAIGVVALVCLLVFSPLCVYHSILLFMAFILLLGLCIVFWQLLLRTRTDAFSSIVAHHTIEHIERNMLVGIMNIDQTSKDKLTSILQKHVAEDAEAEEIEDKKEPNV